MTYNSSVMSCFAQHAGLRSTVQHSSAFLQVKTLLGSSVPNALSTGQSLTSSGSLVVVAMSAAMFLWRWLATTQVAKAVQSPPPRVLTFFIPPASREMCLKSWLNSS